MNQIPESYGVKVRRAIPKRKASVEPGAIFVRSWGYEQTNIDFYMVKEVKNGFAKVVMVESYSEEMSSYMTRQNLPSFQEVGKPFRKKIFQFSGGPWLKGVGSLWNGKPVKSTHYA